MFIVKIKKTAEQNKSNTSVMKLTHVFWNSIPRIRNRNKEKLPI